MIKVQSEDLKELKLRAKLIKTLCRVKISEIIFRDFEQPLGLAGQVYLLLNEYFNFSFNVLPEPNLDNVCNVFLTINDERLKIQVVLNSSPVQFEK